MESELLSTLLEYLISAFASVVARVESLRARMSEAGRQVEGLFEGLLNQAFSDGIEETQVATDFAFINPESAETFSDLDTYTVEEFISQIHMLWADEESPKLINIAEKAVEYRSSISGWLLSLTAEFQKKIKKCDKTIKTRIDDAIREIDQNPIQPKGDTLKPLVHLKGYWRYRIGKYRLVYFPDTSTHKITFSDFDSRGGVYD